MQKGPTPNKVFYGPSSFPQLFLDLSSLSLLLPLLSNQSHKHTLQIVGVLSNKGQMKYNFKYFL